MITCTIAEIPVVVANDKQFSLQKPLGARSILQLTILDQNGELNFQRGDPVSFTDPDTGETYSGFVNSSMPTKFGLLNVFVGHKVTFYDDQYRVQKRTNSDNYFNEFAGDIAVDFARKLAVEGVRVAAAVHRDTTVGDFNQGILSGVTGVDDGNDGALQLVKAGSDLTITEGSSEFSSGALTNVQVVDGMLVPTTQSTIFLQGTCIITQVAAALYVKIWAGSQSIGTNDTLNYSVWISSSSPQQSAFVDIICSDGTYLSTTSSVLDQNDVLVAPGTDLSNYAKDQWYTRQVDISGLHGKTVNTVLVGLTGAAGGTYTAYFKNIYLGSHSGTPFFSTSATTTQQNPPPVFQASGYISNQTQVKVVQSFDPENSFRVSSAYDISDVSLLQNSLLSWNAIQLSNSGLSLSVSYDNGTSYLPCANNAALPVLLPGSNVSAITSLKLREAFNAGTDPTVSASLQSVSLSLVSAPNPTSAKSDVMTTYATATNWNAGTHSSTTVSGNNLIPGTSTRDWADHSTTNQTFFGASGASQSASSGAYVISMDTVAALGDRIDSLSRFDFAGVLADFTAECDVKVSDTVNAGAYLAYRTVAWFAGLDNTYAYIMGIAAVTGRTDDLVSFSKGSNSNSDSSTILASLVRDLSGGTTYHFKLVVNGSHHRFYFNNATTPTFDIIDDTFTGPGNIGFRGLTGDPNNTTTAQIDNFKITPAYNSTWTSTSTSISSLGTCGGSVIAWQEQNTAEQSTGAVTVSSSIDGGSTWQVCSNGGSIPGLDAGTSVSGKSVKIQIAFTAVSQSLLPSVSNLTWRVLGAYPGSSGTRSTVPLVLDSVNRANASGTWNNTDDGQSYTKTGTGTIGISSDEAQISNTTGDVHMRPGSRTATNQEGTVRFSLSASTISAGLELRYVDANNFYRLQVSTTAVSIVKRVGGTTTTLAMVSMALSINTTYRMRFRVVGSNPVALWGNVWLDGSLEPTIDPATYQWDDSLWTIAVGD